MAYGPTQRSQNTVLIKPRLILKWNGLTIPDGQINRQMGRQLNKVQFIMQCPTNGLFRIIFSSILVWRCYVLCSVCTRLLCWILCLYFEVWWPGLLNFHNKNILDWETQAGRMDKVLCGSPSGRQHNNMCARTQMNTYIFFSSHSELWNYQVYTYFLLLKTLYILKT